MIICLFKFNTCEQDFENKMKNCSFADFQIKGEFDFEIA